MGVLDLAQIGRAQTGNYAGWRVAFSLEEPPKPGAGGGLGALAGAAAALPGPIGALLGAGDTLTLSSGEYYAEIEAALQDGIMGGRFNFVFEGLTDDDHGWLVKNFGTTKRLVAKLYLFWQDVGGLGGFFANVANVGGAVDFDKASETEGLVAKLVVTSVQRRLGSRRYETVVTATESAFYALRSSKIETTEQDKMEDVCSKITAASGVKVDFIPPDPPLTAAEKDEKASQDAPAPKNQRCSKILADMVERLQEKFNGPSQALIRDGDVVIGQRKVPYRTGDAAKAGEDPLVLNVETGLIEVSPDAQDMGELSAGDEPEPKLKQYTLTLKCRPDIKPGELVTFKAPPEDVSPIGIGESLLGGLGAPMLGGIAEEPDTKLYVSSVLHRHGSRSGFSTTVKGTVYKDPKKPWTPAPEGDKPQGSEKEKKGKSADPAVNAALTWKKLIDSKIDSLSLLEVGEVWEHILKPVQEQVGLSSTIAEGLAANDGRAQGAHTLSPLRQRTVRGVGFMTPFAWGYCGLVVPRYPGTNVVLGYRKGKANDVVDMGAMWRQGLRPEAKAGDWWLTLPVDAKAPTGSEQKPPDLTHDGKVSNDLIDAKGDRIIETGSFVVRVGKGTLNTSGDAKQRPEMGNAMPEGVTIEHKGSGAKFTIDKDGNITLKGKKISLIADDVDVQVSNKMNVH